MSRAKDIELIDAITRLIIAHTETEEKILTNFKLKTVKQSGGELEIAGYEASWKPLPKRTIK